MSAKSLNTLFQEQDILLYQPRVRGLARGFISLTVLHLPSYCYTWAVNHLTSYET